MWHQSIARGIRTQRLQKPWQNFLKKVLFAVSYLILCYYSVFKARTIQIPVFQLLSRIIHSKSHLHLIVVSLITSQGSLKFIKSLEWENCEGRSHSNLQRPHQIREMFSLIVYDWPAQTEIITIGKYEKIYYHFHKYKCKNGPNKPTEQQCSMYIRTAGLLNLPLACMSSCVCKTFLKWVYFIASITI